MINMSKACTKCKQTQPYSNFRNSKKGKNGLHSQCKVCLAKKDKINRAARKEYHREYHSIYQPSWKENNPTYQKDYWEKNREKLNKYYQNRRKSPTKKLYHSVLDGIRRGMLEIKGNKTNPTLEILGLKNWDVFKTYIESKWEDGMSWENYGNKKDCWSIDHTTPISSVSTIEEVKKLNHYTNLIPMWHVENVKKSNKLLE